MGPPKSYLKRWMLMLGWLMCAVVIHGDYVGKCPEECSCHSFEHPSDGPSLRVECKSSVREDELNSDINELIIAPSPNDPNFLTIGSVLTNPKQFSKLQNLTIINLNVSYIGNHSFLGLHKLRILNITRTKLRNMTMENFKGLHNLTILSLDYNRIRNMERENFKYMKPLRQLSLSHNNISGLFPGLFRGLEKLEILDLSYNPINDLNPVIFEDIKSLISFKCRQCMLVSVESHVYHLAPLIEELDLGNNYLEFLLEDDFIKLRNLKILKLDGNQMSVIVDNFFNETRLIEYLDISNNKIVSFARGCLRNLGEVIQLDASFNKLTNISRATFHHVRESLKIINLSGNDLHLKEISSVLQALYKLEEVILANLFIKNISVNLFMNNLLLKTLDLSNNEITRFPLEALTRNKQLQTLDISHNKINSLDENDIIRLEKIPTIHLSPNEWHCDQCSVESMLTLMKTSVHFQTFRDLKCQEPPRLQGLQFAKLTPVLTDHCPYVFEAIMCAVSGVVLVFITVSAIIIVVIRREGLLKRMNQRGRPEKRSQENSVATIHSPHHPTLNCS